MRLPAWLRWRADRELDEELQAHLELEIQSNISRGMMHEEARFAALRTFGSPTHVRELARETDPLHQLDNLSRDALFSLRMLRRAPLLGVTIVLTLGLGISLNSSTFAVLNALLFRPLVTRNAGTFVQLFATLTNPPSRQLRGSPVEFTLDEYQALQTGSRSLDQVTASAPVPLVIGDQRETQVRGLLVSCNFLSAHIDPPTLGRGFLPQDCQVPGAAPVAVLNESFWRSYLGADPSAVGRDITLNQRKLTIIGVAPNQLTGDVPQAAIWIPYTMQPALAGLNDYFRTPSEHRWLDVSGRLKRGVTHLEAQSELSTMAARLDSDRPGDRIRILLTNGSLVQAPFYAPRAPVVIGLMMGSLTLILAIVCANVATVLLSRAVFRRHEMAIRLALGASRGRLLRQLLTESLILALIASLASYCLTFRLPQALMGLIPDAPRDIPLHPDWRVFGYTLALSIVAACAAGLSPALESLRFNMSGSLKPQGQGGGGQCSSRLRNGLIATQIAVGVAVLASAGLLLRAQQRLSEFDAGFDPKSVVVTPLPLSRAGYDTVAARAFQRSLVERIQGLPGVRSVAIGTSAPFLGQSRVEVTTRAADDPRDVRLVALRKVSPAYFDAAGIRLLRGRVFGEAEAGKRADMGAAPIVISDSFAQALWPGQDPMGKRVRLKGAGQGEVIGVAADISSMRPSQKDGPVFYAPIGGDVVDSILIVRGTADASQLIPGIRSHIHALDSALLPAPETVDTIIRRFVERYSVVLRVASIPAGLALFLCLLGIYGVAAFASAQRTHEIGIRLAIGARRIDVFRLIVRLVARPLMIGLPIGIALAALLGKLFQRMELLVGLNPRDPLTYSAAGLLIASTALLATVAPAYRAARLAPWSALRDD